LEPDIIKNYFGDNQLVVLDEAQNVNQIGLMLKIMVDTYPEIQIIATGSSSFDIANQTGEPLVGRAYTYTLHPLMLSELCQSYKGYELEAKKQDILTFGLMPHVFLSHRNDRVRHLDEIASSYLYKDILEYEM